MGSGRLCWGTHLLRLAYWCSASLVALHSAWYTSGRWTPLFLSCWFELRAWCSPFYSLFASICQFSDHSWVHTWRCVHLRNRIEQSCRGTLSHLQALAGSLPSWLQPNSSTLKMDSLGKQNQLPLSRKPSSSETMHARLHSWCWWSLFPLQRRTHSTPPMSCRCPIVGGPNSWEWESSALHHLHS